MDDENNGVIGFKLDEEPKWVKVTLEDGTVLEIKMEIMAIERTGNDINTGLPIYQMQATNLMRLMKVPKELIKKTGNEGKGMYR